LGLLCACTGFGLLACSATDETRAPAAPVRAASSSSGRELYQRHCVVCHGAQGDGQGQAAYLLSPLPRDFGSGRFRLVSTQNSVPSDDDLVAVLRRGMPGSAMPPFEWLPDEDLASLALYVRELAHAGILRGLEDYAEEEGEDFDEAEALSIAAERTTPGDVLGLDAAPDPSASLIARGKELYAISCAQCHGADGRAREVDVQWNEDGSPTRPRDFTAGIFKGGSSPADIVRRLRCGLPGSPMPATALERSEDAWALASYVASLTQPGAEQRVLQKRHTIVARSLRSLPTAPDAPGWDDIEPVWLALMPLWWRDARIEGLYLRAAHDGARVALQLVWQDPSRDQEFLGTETFTDLVALQLTAEVDPPLFSMGEAGRPVNIWSWKAAWELDLGGSRDVVDRYPHLSADLYGHQPEDAAPLFITARAAGNPMTLARRSSGEELTSSGFGTLASLPEKATTLDARGLWKDGQWRVVFTRALQPRSPGVVDLERGSPAYLALAAWDGSAGDRNGQKSVTVWHALELER
jgi:mono/diheme cytochrome c family protein